MKITNTSIQAFGHALFQAELSERTTIKYCRIIGSLARYLHGGSVTKETLLAFRSEMQRRLKTQTLNGYVSAINAYLSFRGQPQLRLKALRVQQQSFRDERRELTEQEYRRLVSAARRQGKTRLELVIITLGSTGIRVGELRFITVEAVKRGRAEVKMKGKTRTILLPKGLCRRLLEYAGTQDIRGGHIFRTRSGKPLDRTNIGHEMKRLCAAAGVARDKVFPHNLRHLFARLFFAKDKNLARLADVLGHSRLETTRLYVAESASACTLVLERLLPMLL